MTPPRELGVLEEVALRHAWDHEAHGFTPWLSEHLELLSKEIGIPLELEGREVAVSDFSADILARDTTDDSRVLIENQLEGTDHRHLGQLLTYLAGLDAKVVIWIAASFRDAHLSAINWLNEHTVDPFAFFAVKVKVVRIGDSPLAPVLEVLARPNEWDRTLHAVARDNREVSELSRFRTEFWAHLIKRYPEEADDGPASGTNSRWHPVGDLDLLVVQFLGKQRVGVFVRGRRGADAGVVYDHLETFGEPLEARLGVPLKPNADGHFFVKVLDIDGVDPANWDRMADWLHEQAKAYRQTLAEAMGAEA